MLQLQFARPVSAHSDMGPVCCKPDRLKKQHLQGNDAGRSELSAAQGLEGLCLEPAFISGFFCLFQRIFLVLSWQRRQLQQSFFTGKTSLLKCSLSGHFSLVLLAQLHKRTDAD